MDSYKLAQLFANPHAITREELRQELPLQYPNNIEFFIGQFGPAVLHVIQQISADPEKTEKEAQQLARRVVTAACKRDFVVAAPPSACWAQVDLCSYECDMPDNTLGRERVRNRKEPDVCRVRLTSQFLSFWNKFPDYLRLLAAADDVTRLQAEALFRKKRLGQITIQDLDDHPELIRILGLGSPASAADEPQTKSVPIDGTSDPVQDLPAQPTGRKRWKTYTEQRASYDAFRKRLPFKITGEQFRRVARYGDRTTLQRWLAGKVEAGSAPDVAFRDVLKLTSDELTKALEALDKRKPNG